MLLIQLTFSQQKRKEKVKNETPSQCEKGTPSYVYGFEWQNSDFEHPTSLWF